MNNYSLHIVLTSLVGSWCKIIQSTGTDNDIRNPISRSHMQRAFF